MKVNSQVGSVNEKYYIKIPFAHENMLFWLRAAPISPQKVSFLSIASEEHNTHEPYMCVSSCIKPHMKGDEVGINDRERAGGFRGQTYYIVITVV